MRIPDQFAPVQRGQLFVIESLTDARLPAGPESSPYFQAAGVVPSDWQECYGLQGAARELCLGAFQSY
jgi:hypothetical protein